MPGHLTIVEIRQQLLATAVETSSYCSSLQDDIFFHQSNDKWSAAQQIKHLITSTNTAKLAFTLPKFLVRLIAGKPNRNSRSYDELFIKYETKLKQGGKASKRFVPKSISPSYGKDKLLKQFATAMNKIEMAIHHNWKEPQLDQYIAPHPLLGKITLRELCYFTIFHTKHHLHSIKERISEY